MEHDQSVDKRRVNRSTIDDVAKLAKVSKTTVSRYLSGQYHFLADQTRKRIEEAIRQLDYRPNQMARGLKRNRSDLIGMVVADITNPFSTAILRGAEDVCRKHGLNLLVCNTDNDPVREREYIFMLQSHRIDGLIINTTGHNNEFLHQLASDQTPVVLVDRKVPELGFDTVVIDNEQATAEAVRYLLQQGYERIAFFSEPIEGVSTRLERLAGYRFALAEQNRSHTEDLYEVELGTPAIDEKLETFLQDSKSQSRVIFAANGVVMLKILRCLQQKGVAVPGDIAVAGFDNEDWTPVVGSGITVIEQPTYEIGVTAMERVLIRIEGDHSPAQIIVLHSNLISRGSTPTVLYGSVPPKKI